MRGGGQGNCGEEGEVAKLSYAPSIEQAMGAEEDEEAEEEDLEMKKKIKEAEDKVTLRSHPALTPCAHILRSHPALTP